MAKARHLKEVEIDEGTFHVDMSRFRSKEFVRGALEMQSNPDQAKQLALFDMLFEGETGEEVERHVVKEVGYADYVRILEIEGKLMEAADVKN